MEKLLLIDGHSILNRAYYGLPDLTNSEGLHTNAVYGFLNMMFKFIEMEKPTHFAVAFDEHAPTFRHEMYEAYKGTRKPMDPELKMQVPMIQQMLTAMQIPIMKQAGLEADDILGTLAKTAESQGFEVTIVSGDRDLLQLASDHIKISIPKTKKTGTEIENYYAKDVLETKQVTPEEFIDVKALMGDTADNIPGVPSIGEKTATAIIVQFHTVENAYAHLDEVKPPRAKTNLNDFYDQAILSKKLATIEIHADVSLDMQAALLHDFYTEEAYELCRQWEFKNLLPLFENSGNNSSQIEETFRREDDLSKIDGFFASLQDRVGLSIITDGNECYGIAVAKPEETVYFEASGFITADYLCQQVSKLSHRVEMDIRDLKPALKFLSDISEDGFFDTAIAGYLLNPILNSYPMEDLVKTYAGEFIPSYADILGKLTFAKAFDESPELLMRYACFEAYAAYICSEEIKNRLNSGKMMLLYQKIELPLIFTLADMEKVGMAMDGEELLEYGKNLSVRIAELEKEIYEDAGMEFNINSPKQLGEILFERLSLPCEKKTKTGYSTAADVLEKLAVDYPIVNKILEYRQLTKLRSTYVDGLTQALSADGRIHSTFQQTVTATGRISSTEPNLQNIPIRMELGKLIRKVFHSGEGKTYVDADYSQIELRVLAHLSGDDGLIKAYNEGKDIHKDTASRVFHIPFDQVTENDRRNAKAVNFGIVYGISAFGLAKDIGVDRKEAQSYIDSYFEAYPKLKEYLDGLKENAKESGVAYTMFGRKRPIPELSSSNFMQRQFGERVAMNSPIQGTAADIIKIAMVAVRKKLKEENLKSKLVLQVHDELLVEAYDDELDLVKKIMQEEMEHAAELAVKLEIDMHTGKNWYDAK